MRNRTSSRAISLDPPSNLEINHPNSFSIKVHTTTNSLYENIEIASVTRATASRGADFVNNYKFIVSYDLRAASETSDYDDVKYLETMEQVALFLETLLYQN
jgi:hypothetical protein